MTDLKDLWAQLPLDPKGLEDYDFSQPMIEPARVPALQESEEK